MKQENRKLGIVFAMLFFGLAMPATTWAQGHVGTQTMHLYLAPATGSADPIDLGQTAYIAINITGGTAPYSYQWQLMTPNATSFVDANSTMCQNPSGISGNGLNVTCKFVSTPSMQSGTYIFRIVANDSTNATITTPSTYYTVYSQPSVNVSSSNSSILIGNNDLLTAKLSGGSPGFFSVYFVYSNGTIADEVDNLSENATATFSFSPQNAGTYALHVSAKDYGLTNPLTFNSSTTTIHVLTPVPTLSIHVLPGTSMDMNNTMNLSYSISGGGSGAFTAGNFVASNALSGWSTKIPGNTAYFTTPGNYSISLNATNGTTMINDSVPISINRLPQVTSLSAPTPYTGQQTTFSNTTIYGTSPFTYGYTVNAVVSGNYVATSNFTQSGNSFAFTVPGNYFITLTATDADGESASNSTYLNVTSAPVTPAPVTTTTPSSGGQSTGSGGGILPMVTTSVSTLGSCTTISHFYPPVSENIGVDGNKYVITSDMVTPTNAKITVNNESYILTPSVQTNITSSSSNVYLELVNLTYVSSGHIITLDICSRNTTSSAPTTVNVNNSKTNQKMAVSISMPASNISVAAGSTISIANLTTGGTAPFTYAYLITPRSGYILNGNKVTFNSPGNYTIELMVGDSYGNYVTSKRSILVTNTLAPAAARPSNTLVAGTAAQVAPANGTASPILPVAIVILIAIALGVAAYGYSRNKSRYQSPAPQPQISLAQSHHRSSLRVHNRVAHSRKRGKNR